MDNDRRNLEGARVLAFHQLSRAF
ncbi:hypothetical protein D018_2328A, partial [Vibrio parahaemolyticus VP2007-007]